MYVYVCFIYIGICYHYYVQLSLQQTDSHYKLVTEPIHE